MPELAGRLDIAPGKTYGGNVPGRAAGADPARPSRRRMRPRPQRRPLAALHAAVDADARLAGRGAGRRWSRTRATPRWWRAGCARSARAPRPTSCGGWARPRAPSAGRWPTSAPSRCRSTAATTGWVLPDDLDDRRPRRAVGGAAAGARPDRDGLEAARLLPRPARAAALRHATATAAPPPGGTAASSAAGSRTPTGWCWSPARGRPTPPGARPRAEAARLTAWLDGTRVGTVYPSPAMKRASVRLGTPAGG